MVNKTTILNHFFFIRYFVTLRSVIITREKTLKVSFLEGLGEWNKGTYNNNQFDQNVFN